MLWNYIIDSFNTYKCLDIYLKYDKNWLKIYINIYPWLCIV
jgi:hypothetical protein